MQGKNETVASGAVPLIIALLLHQSAGVRVAASSALVHITNAESGKEAVVTGDKERSGGDNISLLITSLYDQNTYVQCNVLHILTNVCENTKSTLSGEIDGVNTLEKIRELEEMSPDATVRDAATNALKRLQWIP